MDARARVEPARPRVYAHSRVAAIRTELKKGVVRITNLFELAVTLLQKCLAILTSKLFIYLFEYTLLKYNKYNCLLHFFF